MLYLNAQAVRPTIFPDKTSQVWHLPPGQIQRSNIIEWVYESECEFMHLAQLRELTGYGTGLKMLYLPYARQDKRVDNETSFALIPFMRLINRLDFAWVEVYDPHNYRMVRTYLERVRIIEPKAQIEDTIAALQPNRLCYPDAGALERYGDMVSWPCIHAVKTRDPTSGEITDIQFVGDPQGQKILIVDDLCDGGRTFIELAKKLYEAKTHEVYLYVSHGLFTKGTGVLRDAGIKRIFTREGEVLT